MISIVTKSCETAPPSLVCHNINIKKRSDWKIEEWIMFHTETLQRYENVCFTNVSRHKFCHKTNVIRHVEKIKEQLQRLISTKRLMREKKVKTQLAKKAEENIREMRWKSQPFRRIMNMSREPCHGCVNEQCQRMIFDAARRYDPDDEWRDIDWCIKNTDFTSPVNSNCASSMCKDLARSCLTYTGKPYNIVILAIDNRRKHPGSKMWRDYCNRNNYTFVQRAPSVSLNATTGSIMSVDWQSTMMISRIIFSNAYDNDTYFLYTELDQWIVNQRMRLEPIIDISFEKENVFLSISEEYPCKDVRGGGFFNTGTFFMKRDPRLRLLLERWHASTYHGGSTNPVWPARQGAFSHDPSVYMRFASHIHSFESGCVMGSPYALVIPHTLGGFISKIYDPDKARQFQSHVVSKCVIDSYAKNLTCNLSPVIVGGMCEYCTVDGFRTCCGVDGEFMLRKARQFRDMNAHTVESVASGDAPIEFYAIPF